ncbi:hypothetical protein CALCODRAFT_86704 [Calocera cornea HHB12733]|uniref:Uncharacterized protein n=1 Tax=Calocera cornea HHB12733 TaxID=1353952 RepID=A0A165DCS4_9BASI|nr:hypothetical protein CALCODRAFT_86704 [Calocera cornea HHB12733]
MITLRFTHNTCFSAHRTLSAHHNRLDAPKLLVPQLSSLIKASWVRVPPSRPLLIQPRRTSRLPPDHHPSANRTKPLYMTSPVSIHSTFLLPHVPDDHHPNAAVFSAYHMRNDDDQLDHGQCSMSTRMRIFAWLNSRSASGSIQFWILMHVSHAL